VTENTLSGLAARLASFFEEAPTAFSVSAAEDFLLIAYEAGREAGKLDALRDGEVQEDPFYCGTCDHSPCVLKYEP
jgi:hypothetical protein